VIDGSLSMALEGSAKPEASLGLAALFATAAANAGYSHCAWLARAGCERVENGTGRPANWRGIEFDYRGHPTDSLVRLAPAWRRQGLRVLISDLLWLGEPLVLLQHLTQGAAGAVVVQLLAQADIAPPERGNVRLVDSETGQTREIFVDGAAVERYRDGLARHRQNWQAACRQIGAVLVSLVAEETVGDWRLEELIAAEVLKVGYG
jgi:hypothetical protein